MITRIAPERVRALNDRPERAGEYVLYWMQSSHRTEENPALQYAIERANHAHLPLIVYFGLWQEFPEANMRHFRFLLEGLAHVAQQLESLGIRFVLRNEPPDAGALSLAGRAAILVVDRGYCRPQQSWYRIVAEQCRCAFVQVEGNVVVPVEVASVKEEYSAATFRRKITRLVDHFLYPITTEIPDKSSVGLEVHTLAGESIDAILAGLTIDRSVPGSLAFTGGTPVAERRFAQFREKRLDGFSDDRNDPGVDGCSGMSPYLHFGQVSPVTLAFRALEHGGEGVSAFLEELIVRRELAVNFVRFNDRYDDFTCLPAWAQKTLGEHVVDPREYHYSRADLERARTHDPFWNAAQDEMVKTGKMQGYMRMYWGKKILEWSPTPQEAYAAALFLNNKYEIDGRDPSGYAGVAWCFGKHDRPWRERSVFGMVRYMNARGLRRKFAMDRYLEKVRQAI